jgi:hypothetical protein
MPTASRRTPAAVQPLCVRRVEAGFKDNLSPGSELKAKGAVPGADKVKCRGNDRPSDGPGRDERQWRLIAVGYQGDSDPTIEHSLRPWAHLRAYLAGVGATTALTSGALVVFVSLATVVAFKGLPHPFGGWSDNAGAAYLDYSSTSAVARNAAPGSHAASPATRSGGRAAGRDLAGRIAAARAGPAGAGPAGGGGGSGRAEPGVATSPGDITPPPVAGPSPPSTSGPATDAVQGVDNAAGTNLSGPTNGVTGAVDGAATNLPGATNGVTGTVGAATGALNH